MIRKALALGVLVLTAAPVLAQDPAPATFEVASVKMAPLGDTRRSEMKGGPGTKDPGRITITRYTLGFILRNLYGLQKHQIAGPPFLETECYDIAAVIPPGTTKGGALLMMKNLLAERFRMRLHLETKELPIYALRIGKHGHTIKSSEQSVDADASDTSFLNGFSPQNALAAMGGRGSDGFPIMDPKRFTGLIQTFTGDKAKITAIRQPIQKLADTLSYRLDRPVVNQTGLTGLYDFILYWTPEKLGATSNADADLGVSIYAAIGQQLGLTLVATKDQVPVLVIDSAERAPIEN
jgi:uncharacterized protein (TIGR03435 family)